MIIKTKNIHDVLIMHKRPVYLLYSAGLDSTVLAYILKSIDIDFKLVFFNHKGLGSDDALSYALRFSKNISRTLIIKTIDPRLFFKNSEGGEREARLHVLYMFKQGIILSAHHADDNTETILLNILRGSSINGLTGIKELVKINNLLFFRPLLSYRKADLLEYAELNKLEHYEDPDNYNLLFKRNWFRFSLKPILIAEHLGFEQRINQLSNHMNNNYKLLMELAEIDLKALDHRSELLKLSDARIANLISYKLKTLGVYLMQESRLYELIRQIRESNSKKSGVIEYIADLKILIQHQRIVFVKQFIKPIVHSINWNAEDYIYWPNLNKTLGFKYAAGKGLSLKHGPIKICTRDPAMTLFTRKQHKSFKNIAQELGMNAYMRSNWPLVSIHDKLTLIIGYTIDDNYRASSSELGLVIDIFD